MAGNTYGYIFKVTKKCIFYHTRVYFCKMIVDGSYYKYRLTIERGFDLLLSVEVLINSCRKNLKQLFCFTIAKVAYKHSFTKTKFVYK